jgi:ankyrin repeat protein
VVKLLLEKAVDVDSKDRSGRTPLSWARGKGREAVMKLLVEKDADVDTGSGVIGPRDFPEEYPASPRNRPKIWRTVEYLWVLECILTISRDLAYIGAAAPINPTCVQLLHQ